MWRFRRLRSNGGGGRGAVGLPPRDSRTKSLKHGRLQARRTGWLARQQLLLEAPASAIAAHASSAALAYVNGTMQLKLHRTGEMTARSRGLRLLMARSGPTRSGILTSATDPKPTLIAPQLRRMTRLNLLQNPCLGFPLSDLPAFDGPHTIQPSALALSLASFQA